MPPLFEPGLGTLLALEREFQPLLKKQLRRVLRGTNRQLFAGGTHTGGASLSDLAGRIVELQTTLGAEATASVQVAKAYLLASLRSKHQRSGASSDRPQVLEDRRVAKELLARLQGPDA